MSQIEDRVETLLDETKTVELRSRWPFRIFIAVLLLGVAGGLSFFTFRSRTYTATAWIQILSQRPYFIYSEGERISYVKYVETQFSIIKSPLILDKALEDPEVAKIVLKYKPADKAAWLAKNLKLKTQGESEMITISISLPNKNEPDKIVNAVVNAFFDYYANQSSDWNSRLIMQLNLEFNRQQAAARLLQDEIRAQMEEAARQGGTNNDVNGGFLVAETLVKEIALNESKLMTLRAELKMLQQLLEEGPKVTQSAVWRAIEKDKELADLFEQKMLRLQNVDAAKKVLPGENNSELTTMEKQVEFLDQMIEARRKELEKSKTHELRMEMVADLERQIAEKDRNIRTTGFLVQELKQKYKEAVSDVGDRTTKIVDISFQQAQLKRVDKVLNLLQERITRLETERYAPDQIQLKKKATVPDASDSRWFW